MPCGLPFRRYFQDIWCWECPASCLPAGTFKAFGAWNALRAANPQVLSRGIWCLECPCVGTFKAFGAWNVPAGCHNPQVLLKQSVLEMPSWLPTRRYFQGIWCFKRPASCQPAGTFKAFGAWNALRAAKAFGAWNALRAANPKVLSRHLVLGMPCGLPTRSYFPGIWCLKYSAGCQPALGMPCGLPQFAGTFKAFGAWNALRAANPQVLSRHFVLGMLCELPNQRYFKAFGA